MSKSEWKLDWTDDAKVAVIYYCYLALEKTIGGEEKSKHLAAQLDIMDNLEWYYSMLGLTYARVPDDDLGLGLGGIGLERKEVNPEYQLNCSIAFNDFSDVKVEIVNYCDEVIAGFEDDERYECIIKEMDRFASDSNSGILLYNSRKYLWVFVMYSVAANILTVLRRKYLNHLCRIAGIDKSVLLEMEEVAKSFITLGRKRLEAKAFAKAYSRVESILETLDAEEQALHEKIKPSQEMVELFKSFNTIDRKRLEVKSSGEAYSRVENILETLDAEERPLLAKLSTMSVLPQREWEETIKSIDAINKKRLEIKASDQAYSRLADILDTLDAEEKALHEKVNTLLKPK